MGIAQLHWTGACLSAAALWLAVGQADARQSHNWEQDKKWCENKSHAYSAELAISGCTAFIQSGRYSGKNLAGTLALRGTAFAFKKEYDRAIADFSEAIRLDPKYVYALRERGNAYLAKGDHDRAITDYDKAIRLDPKGAYAYGDRCAAYDGKKEYDRAIADCDEAIRLDPKSAYAFGFRSDAYLSKEDYDHAIADSSDAIRLDPNAAYGFADRCLAYYFKKEYDRAITDCNEAIRLDPTSAAAFNTRGSAFAGKKEYDRAIADFSEAIHLDSGYSVCFKNRGQVYSFKEDYDRAIADFSEAIRLDPKYVYALHERGNAYLAKGDHDRAITDYDEVIRLNPNAAYAYRARCQAYYFKKEYDRAITDCNEAIRLDPKSAHAFNTRCALYNGKGDYDRAIVDCDEAVRLDPKLANPFRHRCLAYNGKGDYSRAIDDCSEAIRLNPEYAAAFETRGEAYEARGELAKAKADFEMALRLPAARADITGAQEVARAHLTELARKEMPLTQQHPGDGMKAGQENAGHVRAELQSANADAGKEVGQRAQEISGPAPDPGIRAALVIGNSGYRYVPFLPNPRRDAEVIADTLRKLGFQTVLFKPDVTLEGFLDALKEFRESLKQGTDWAVIYFAGHGLEMDGIKYFVPVDAKLKEDTDVKRETVSLDELQLAAQPAKRLHIMILDACRNNPFVPRMKLSIASRSIPRGFSRLEPEAGELVAFSAGEGQTADDGDGEHSPFTQAFLTNIVQPHVEIDLLFRRVHDEVEMATRKKQRPATYSSLPGEQFYFAVK